MKRCATLFVVALLVIFCSRVIGAEGDTLAEENAKLRGRVDKLEQELAEIKAMLLQQAQQAKAVEQTSKPVKIEELTEEDIARLSELLREKGDKKLVKSGLDIDIYGFIKADASYNDSRVTTGNFMKWVDSENLNRNDNEFNLTANQTRLGMHITGPENQGLLTSGRVEVDFYGNGTAENKPGILVRHAYMKMDWPEDNFSIIAGQTSDVISPLVPTTLNYSVAWWAGNIGYRRPQIRFTKGYTLSDKTSLKFEAAIARTIGRGSDSDLVDVDSESGEDAGYPSVQGRVSLTTPLLTKLPATVGVSGHYGREEYDIDTEGQNKKFESWSLNVDLHQPINDWLALKSEAFVGENLNQYLGGIGQGVNVDTTKARHYREIGSRGGWVAASITPQGKWKYNLGASLEDVQEGDLNVGDRSQNRSIFGNAIYSINKNTSVGIELSQWHTERIGQKDADSLRAQTSFIYKF